MTNQLTPLDSIIGKKIARVYVDQDFLRFETDTGERFTFEALGDRWSSSVFYDFSGVRKLFDNGPVVSIREIGITPTDVEETEDSSRDRNGIFEAMQPYGYEIVTVSPELGEQTSVFSFRNYSDDPAGGWIEESNNNEELPELLDDTDHIPK